MKTNQYQTWSQVLGDLIYSLLLTTPVTRIKAEIDGLELEWVMSVLDVGDSYSVVVEGTPVDLSFEFKHGPHHLGEIPEGLMAVMITPQGERYEQPFLGNYGWSDQSFEIYVDEVIKNTVRLVNGEVGVTSIRTSELSAAEALTQIHDLLLRNWSIGNVLNIVQRINDTYVTQINMVLSDGNLCYRRRAGSYSIHYQAGVPVRHIATLVTMALVDVVAGWSDELYCTVVRLDNSRYEVQYMSTDAGMFAGLQPSYPVERVVGIADYITKAVLPQKSAINGEVGLGELFRQLDLSLLLEPLK